MKKFKFLSVVFGILMVGALTGCGNDKTATGNSTNATTNTKGKCTVTECIKKINSENTVEQINDIIGFEGELIDEKYNIYYWELSEETGVKVAYYSSGKGTISIKYERESLANSKVNFSKYSELKQKINEGILYDEFKSYIGGVEGIIVEKSSTTTKYIWVSTDGQYIIGTFRNQTGKCSYASGMIK